MKPWQKKCWCIPPQANAAFVHNMEDVLEVYRRPPDDRFPVVCVDETSKQLVSETRVPQPPAPGQPVRYDYEYRRNGVCNLFLLAAPKQGWRTVQVTARRTKLDFAAVLRDLVDVHFPQATKVVLVCDNLNTHHPRVLYEAFPPAEARRIAARLEWHYTPKHGSWLNIAEIEFAALAAQCLDRRIASEAVLQAEIEAWVQARNALGTPVNWHFTTEDARIKLLHLYPTFE
ncbi:MAG: IS630 family transposase [Caldilineaceae bacterium]|nr:IS630 family transposase [Caldilineaceae bacterium]